MNGIIEGYVCDRCMERPGIANDDSADPVYFCVECKAEMEITAQIIRMESVGTLEPGCPTCERTYESMRAGKGRPMMPSHKASSGCESGSRNHCTCDTCF